MVRVWFAVCVWVLGLAWGQTGLPQIPLQTPLYGPFQVEKVLAGNRFLVAGRVFGLAGVEVFAADERTARAQARRLGVAYRANAAETARGCLGKLVRERPVYLELEDQGVLGDALWGYAYFPFDPSPQRVILLTRPLFVYGGNLLENVNVLLLREGCGWFTEPQPLKYRDALQWAQEQARKDPRGIWR